MFVYITRNKIPFLIKIKHGHFVFQRGYIVNRNKMMIINTAVVLVTIALNTILGMVEVKLFLQMYGDIINGLIQTGNQVLGYLSLIESGICAAYLCKFYKPVAENNRNKISSLYVGFCNTMKSVVYKMLVVATLICAIYPLFLINDYRDQLSYFTMVSIFILLSLRAILPYRLTMVPKYMIVLKEQNYKAEFISGISKSIQLAIEIIIILYFKPQIQVLLFLTVIISLITGLWFKYVMKKLYKGQLNKDAMPDNEPNSMSKDILAHNISSLAFNSTDNIVLSFYSLIDVTIYSAYNMIVQKAAEIIQKILQGASATLSIKIVSKDEKAYDIYREMLSGSYFIAGIISTVFILMINPFIELWIGSKYCLEMIDVLLFGFILYAGNILPVLYIARNAKGLYKESRNFTVAQAALNIIITVSLVPKIGITGALLGTFVARAIITVPMNYRLIYRKVFPDQRQQWVELIANAVLVLTTTIIVKNIVYNIALNKDLSVITFIIHTVVAGFITTAIITLYYYLTDSYFRCLVKRALKILKRKF